MIYKLSHIEANFISIVSIASQLILSSAFNAYINCMIFSKIFLEWLHLSELIFYTIIALYKMNFLNNIKLFILSSRHANVSPRAVKQRKFLKNRLQQMMQPPQLRLMSMQPLMQSMLVQKMSD